MRSREKIDGQVMHLSARFDSLDRQTQRIISCLLETSKPNPGDEYQDEDRIEIAEVTYALAQLISRLEAVNRDSHRHIRALALAAERGLKLSSTSEQNIVADIEMLDVSNDEEWALQNSIQTQILESLCYSMMSNRYERVVEAYPNTFEWIFRSSTNDQLQWSNFSDWLKTDTNQRVYWISGKAGSGKSTLMKHIFDDARTSQYLAV